MATENPNARPDPDKEDWADHVDTTLAHNRGTLGDAQLEAEGRELPKGLPRTRRPSGAVETATARPTPERAVVEPSSGTPPAEASDEAPEAEPVEDLAELTVKELKARAKAAGVEGYSSMLKDDLVAALS